jgi:beta-galactosidase GanA
VGSYNNPRDFGPEAQKLFAQPIPPALAKKTGKSGTWAQAFGKGADRAFNSWYTARFIDEMAAAGKAVKPIPMFVNAALHSPFGEADPASVSSGGPQWDVLDIWKAAAPNIDFAAPDIYAREEKTVSAYLDGYARPDNALFVPEIGNAAEFARFFWPVLGRGGIGFAPFGMDATDFYNYPLGAKRLDAETLDAFGEKFALFARIGRDWAKASLSHPTWGTARPDDGSARSTQMGDWKINVSFEEWQFGHRDWTWLKRDPVPWAGKPVGGAAVMQIAPDQFLVAGDYARVTFSPGPDVKNGLLLKVEEGRFEGGKWVTSRVWNGDQTDYGLTFNEKPALLRVTMGTYK